MGVLTEICQRESSHGQQYEIKHIEQAVLHNLVGTYAATVQDDASRNGAGKIAQTEKNQNLRQCSVKYFLFWMCRPYEVQWDEKDIQNS